MALAIGLIVMVPGVSPTLELSRGSNAGAMSLLSSPTFSLARLASLQNYRYTAIAASSGHELVIDGAVHGPTDWKISVTSPVKETTYDVNGRGVSLVLGQVVPVTFQTPRGYSHLDGEYSAAQSLVGYTHVLGIRIRDTGPCVVAGEIGTSYYLVTPSASAGLVREAADACVARSSGALLKYSAGVPSGSAAKEYGIQGLTYTFSVTSIGGVAAISAPKAPPPTTTTTLRPLPPSSALPSGFPSSIPAPPGQVLSGYRLSSTKWYVELTGERATTWATYIAQLKQRGLSVVSSTSTSAVKVADLQRGSLQVVVEQIVLPGEGVTLTLTVST